MSLNQQKYCLDANILIQAWQKYYCPTLCPSYWDVLNQLGTNNTIFLPEIVYEEITRTEDDLTSWLKSSKIPIRSIDSAVSKCLTSIYAADPSHKYLVSSTGQHSIADPWVIAHAINENAKVVTKESKDSFTNPTKIKIPHVCDNMGVGWLDDFAFAKEIKLKFSCTL
ncbi:MAG: DUF4411 family protein [Chitinophagales bacterium]|nr:DUF4411 family protein [Chitinophagales bacterium]